MEKKIETQEQRQNKSMFGQAIDRQLAKYGIEPESIFSDSEPIGNTVYYRLRDQWIDEKSTIIFQNLMGKESSKFKAGIILGLWAIYEKKQSESKKRTLKSVRYEAVVRTLDKLFNR